MHLESHGEIALLRMNAGKANAIHVPVLEQLDARLDAVDAPALVLTGYDRFFCAGLDLPALVDLDRDAMRGLMETFERVFLRLFRMPIPVVAAINGHAIAGGCVLALQADYRVMREGDYRIGLNETALAVGLPALVVETLRFHVPAKSYVQVALRGRLFAPAKARRLGLVDEVVADPEARALNRARKLASVPGPGFANVKGSLRALAVARIEEANPAARERWLDTWFSPEARELVRDMVTRLQS